MFHTLLASNAGSGPWVRPALAAGVLHVLIILGAVRGTATTQPSSMTALRDTIRLELTPSRPEVRTDQTAPRRPVPGIPSPPSELPAIPPLRLEPVAPLSSPVDLAALTRPTGLETPIESSGNGSKKSVFAVGEVDQPPELMRDFHPQYPELLRQSGVGGTVQLEYLIDSTGRVAPASIRVLASTHAAFSASAIEAVQDARFKPARRRGHAVAVVARQSIRFVRE